MADKIKGITVQIGGDTAPLSKALRQVDKEIRSTQANLKEVNKLLKLDPNNTNLLKEKQKLLADQIGKTEQKLQGLKKAQEEAKQMLANPRVELCAFDGQEWLRLAATAVWDEDIAAQEHMLEGYPHLRAMYTPGDGNSAVFYLKDAKAVFSSFTAAPRTVTF